jgi:hypothetical protein
MHDTDRLRLAQALKGKYRSKALHAYIDAAETEIIALRLRARPVLSAAEVRAKKATYMREYRRRVKVRGMGLLEAA